MTTLINFYPYQWNFGDEKDLSKPFTRKNGTVDYQERNIIRIWGWNQLNETVCVRVEDFMVPMWIELPRTAYQSDKPIEWTEKMVATLRKLFEQGLKPRRTTRKIAVDRAEGGGKEIIEKESLVFAPFSFNYTLVEEERYRLYDNEFLRVNGKLQRKVFQFFRLSFTSSSHLRNMVRYLEEPIDFMGHKILLRCFCENPKLTPVMKLLAINKLPSTNWLTVRPTKVVTEDKTSNKQHEYIVPWKNISAHPDPDSMPLVSPLVCSFDIETFSSQFPKFPDPKLTDDRILVIGCTFARRGEVLHKACLSLSLTPDLIEDGQTETRQGDTPDDRFDVIWYKKEHSLMQGWRDIINKFNPDVLIGYNIFKFDITFMHARAQLLNVEKEFLDISCCNLVPGKMGGTSWESEARGKVEMKWVDAQGRLFIDLYPYIMANENLQSYKLDFVASKYLGMHKDPISPRDIYDCWNDRNQKLYDDVIKYCAQDTLLPYKLFEKLLVWLSLSESASVNKVPIFAMVTQGQQIKAFSQVFDYCFHNDMVCNPPEKKVKQAYRGAIVTEPKAGLYKMILPFDFASLYPSIIIAHNLDFSTFIKPEDVPLFKYVKYDKSDPRYIKNDNEIEVFEWEDHVGCACPKDENLLQKQKEAREAALEEVEEEEDEPMTSVRPRKKPVKKVEVSEITVKRAKNPVCASYKYYFMKANALGSHGVIPTIIKELLAARKKVRKVIEANEDKIHDLEESMKVSGADILAIKANIVRLKDLNKVLDKRQLAFKVNANSMYGMFGAENGYLPFFPGAETVTYVGRRSILDASERLVQVHGGEVIYNDTDSAYCYFESQANRSVKDVWDFSTKVVEDIATLFPPPMKLEFEGKIYVRFLIFTKKKYVAQMLDQHGKLKENMYLRGVPLVRREYCENMKYIYEKAVRFVMNNIDIVTHLNKKDPKAMERNPFYHEYYMMVFQHFLNIMSRNSSRVVPEVQVEEEDVMEDDRPTKRLKLLDGYPTSIQGKPCAENDSSYYKEFVIYKTLKKEKYANKLAHAEVAEKIRARGTPVDVNTRIEYVMLGESTGGFSKAKRQYEIAEELGYFLQFRNVLRLDFLQYLSSQYVNFMNQVTKTIFGLPQVCTVMFKRLLQKNMLIDEIRRIRQDAIVHLHEEVDPRAAAKIVTIKTKPVGLHYALLGKSIQEWANWAHQELCLREHKTFEPVYPDTLLCEQYVSALYVWYVEKRQDTESVYGCFHAALEHYPEETGWTGWRGLWTAPSYAESCKVLSEDDMYVITSLMMVLGSVEKSKK